MHLVIEVSSLQHAEVDTTLDYLYIINHCMHVVLQSCTVVVHTDSEYMSVTVLGR